MDFRQPKQCQHALQIAIRTDTETGYFVASVMGEPGENYPFAMLSIGLVEKYPMIHAIWVNSLDAMFRAIIESAGCKVTKIHHITPESN